MDSSPHYIWIKRFLPLLILAAAWVLHAFWDFLHRVTALGDGVPEGYPEFCLTYDLLLAGLVAYMWAAGA